MDHRADVRQEVIMMRLSWKPSFSASAMHSAFAVAMQWPVQDAKLRRAIEDAAMRIHSVATACDPVRPRRFWDTLISLSSEIDSNHDLAYRVLTRTAGPASAGSTAMQTTFAGAITDLEAAYVTLYPKLIEQLELRSRPIRELWTGYGNGLLAHIGRLTDRELIVEQAEVVLVQPILGGFGGAHLEQNRVRWEAVLTNPMPELPEVVRLSWLLSQLMLDAPKYSEGVHGTRLTEIAGLAMLPPALAAGQVVELTQIDEPTLALAIEQWHVPVPTDVDVIGTLFAWWETYLQTRPAWSVGLTALDRMLASSHSSRGEEIFE